MADKAIFEIIVSDKGVKISQKNVDSFGASVEKTTNKTNKLGESQERAGRAADRHSTALNGGVASANNSARSMSRLLDTVGGNNSGLVAAYATLATNAFAVSAAFNLLKEARGVEMTLQGLESVSERVGTELSVIASSMRDVTGQAIDMSDALRYTSQLTAAGLRTEQIDKLTRSATTAAYALGREVPDSIQRLTLAVAKNEPELVDELGMTIKSTEAWKRYALQAGTTAEALTDQQKKIALLDAWTQQTADSYGDLTEKLDPNEYSQLAASFKELTRGFIDGTSQFLRLGDVVTYMAENTTALIGVISVSATVGFNMASVNRDFLASS